MVEQKGVPLFAHAFDENLVGELIRKRQEVDYECFQLLAELQSGFWLEEIVEWYEESGKFPGDLKDLEEFRERVESALERRSHLTNEMLKVVCGQ